MLAVTISHLSKQARSRTKTDPTQLWHFEKRHNYGTLEKDTIMAHWKKTQLWHIGKGHNCGTLEKDTIMPLWKRHNGGTLEKDTIVAFWKKTQLWHFELEYFHDELNGAARFLAGMPKQMRRLRQPLSIASCTEQKQVWKVPGLGS